MKDSKKELKRYTWDEFKAFAEESESSGFGDYTFYYDVFGSDLAFKFNDGYIDKLEAENKKYKEALEFYADTKNWSGVLGCGHLGVIHRDDFIIIKHPNAWGDNHMIEIGGKRAIEVLREIEDSRTNNTSIDESI